MKEYLVHPYWSIKNTWIILLAFLRTIIIGIPAIIVLLYHFRDWSPQMKGEYIWNVGHTRWAPWILERADVAVNVNYKEQIDWSKPCVVIANHESAVDALVIVGLLPRGRVIAKKEALWYPFIGAAIKLGAQIVVDRHKRAKNKDNHEAMNNIRNGIAEWPSSVLVVFPEGTRTKDGGLGEFRYGAFAIAKENDLPIVPIAIKGGFKVLSKGSLLRFRPTNIDVAVGHTIGVEFSQKYSVPELAKESRSIMLQLLSE